MSNFIYGIRSVIEAIDAGKEPERIFIQNGINNPLLKELKDILKKHNFIWQQVPVEKLNRLTTKNHQGVICFLSEISYDEVENLLPMIFEKGEVPLLLMLDRLTDVRNIGAIARTAACTGVHALIVPSRGSAQINADAVKTSAGALNKITVCREHDLKRTLQYLKECGLQIVSCTEKTESLIYDVDYTVPTVIIMGSEDDGISGEYLKMSDCRVKIPMTGVVGSLNVSVATGVILYEAIRQKLKN